MWLIGTEDVDARLELMRQLQPLFEMSAVGSKASLRPVFESHGFRYHAYDLARPHKVTDGLAALRQLTALFRAGRPDIVHSFDTAPAIWARLAATRAGVPVVIGTLPGLGRLYSEHEWRVRVKRAGYEWLQRVASRKSHATVFQNDEDRRQLTASGVVPGDRAFVIRSSGIDTRQWSRDSIDGAALADLRAELAPSGHAVVTMVSRLSKLKGVLDFGAAARHAHAAGAAVTFVLIGGEDAVDRIPPAELDELKRSVRWLGRRSDVPILLAASDIFVLPTRYREGVPRALVEAAAMGLPLLATDTPGCRDVVIDGVNGALVPQSDPAALADAVLALVADPERRRSFGAAARQHVCDNFELSGVADASAELYRRLLDKRLHRPTD